ncbi:hypothetical protein [Sabulibacter ruber]|uniref:hypothetical protein n=1 Tax=Sabulibacter ruber TaxID=2811901 RepID=UPI001A958524|nr:hypothetical protein [Sabulibacter ruber]
MSAELFLETLGATINIIIGIFGLLLQRQVHTYYRDKVKTDPTLEFFWRSALKSTWLIAIFFTYVLPTGVVNIISLNI